MLSEEAKEYIKYNNVLLKEDNFQEFFNECDDNNKCELAEFFLFDCKINFLEYMTEIPEWLFYSSEKLKNISIPNNIIKINDNAFHNCDKLKSISIPDSVIEIEKEAFCWCESLQSITIPDSVTKIGKNAFYMCNSLKEIKIPKHLKENGLELSNIGIYSWSDIKKITYY